MFEGEEAGEKPVGKRFDAGAVILQEEGWLALDPGWNVEGKMKEDAVFITPAVQIITF